MRDQIVGETEAEYEAGEARFIPALVKSPDGRKLALAWADASDKSVVARAMYDDMTTDMRPALGAIETPVTVVYPWDSTHPFTTAQTDGLYQGSYAALPHKTFKRIDGSYHFIMLDQPEAFETTVEDFLR